MEVTEVNGNGNGNGNEKETGWPALIKRSPVVMS